MTTEERPEGWRQRTLELAEKIAAAERDEHEDETDRDRQAAAYPDLKAALEALVEWNDLDDVAPGEDFRDLSSAFQAKWGFHAADVWGRARDLLLRLKGEGADAKG